ncbi:MAG: erythromycin esterase family protein [Bacteroidota bacterium]
MKYLQTLILALSFLRAFSQQLALFPVNREDSTYNDLQPLKQIIGAKRVVMLGEINHWYGTPVSDKIRVLKFLREEMGFELVAFESGMYDLQKASEEIKNGKNAATAIHQSLFPVWTLQQEFKPLIDYLALHKDSLLLVGFDCQFSGGDFYEYFEPELRAMIKNTKPEISDDEFSYWLDNVDEILTFNSMEAPLSIFQVLHHRVEKAVSKLPDEEKRSFMLRILAGIDAMAKDNVKNMALKSEKDFKASDNNARDEQMAENLLWWMKKYPGKKIICWGANAHFANKVAVLQEEEMKTFHPMGELVRHQAEKEVISILFTGIPAPVTNDSTSLENQYIAPGYIDLRTTEAAKDLNLQALDANGKAMRGNWREVTDVLWFCGRMDSATTYLPELAVEEAEPDSMTEPGSTTAKSTVLQVTRVMQHGSSVQAAALQVKITILDAKSKLGLEYANVLLSGKSLGTISNSRGEALLAVPRSVIADTVRISMVGYESRYLPVRELLARPIVYLRPSSRLRTVEISAKKPDAVEIMKQVIRAIPQNYNQDEFTQRRLSVARVSIGGKYKMNEILYDTYDDDGYRKVPLFPIRYQGYESVIAMRRMVSDSMFETRDSIAVYLPGEIHGMLRVANDVVDLRNNNFLNKSNLGKYRFHIAGTTMENGELQYIIGFSCRKPTFRRATMSISAKTYTGQLWINKSDFAITRVRTYSIIDMIKYAEGYQHLTGLTYPFDSTQVYYEKSELNYSKTGRYYYNNYCSGSDNMPWPWRGGDNYERLISVEEGKRPKPDYPRRGLHSEFFRRYDEKGFEKLGM